jgi:hypothetical protein
MNAAKLNIIIIFPPGERGPFLSAQESFTLLASSKPLRDIMQPLLLCRRLM